MLLKNILTYLCVSGQKPNHIKSEPIGLRTCVSYPNALLLAQPAFVNITKVSPIKLFVIPVNLLIALLQLNQKI